jgi:Peptidase family S41
VEPSPPRPSSARGVENLAAAARLLAYVRFFHPSDEALAVGSWDHFAVKLMEDVESADDAQELARRLNEVFAPIAAAVVVWAGAPEDAPATPPAPPDAASVRFWRHFGAGTIASPGSIYTSDTVTVPLRDDGESKSVGVPCNSVKSLGGGVSCRLPVAVHVGSDGSLPRPTVPNPWQEPAASRQSLTALNRSTRLAGVAIAWGVMQHFYPYFDMVETDWDAALLAALSDAADDADELAYLETLARLIAKLQDGHGQVSNPRLMPTLILPVYLGWAGADLVVTGRQPSAPAEIAVGDTIIAIGGQSVDDRCAELAQRISAATDGWRRMWLIALLCRGSSDDAVRVRVRKLDGDELDATLVPIPLDSIQEEKPTRRANGTELAPGIRYFDLDGAELETLTPLYDELVAASAVIFDLRGYPANAAVDLLVHLIGEDATSPIWNIPIVTTPDREDWTYNTERWTLEPQAPRLAAKIAFLTNGVAISYAETILGIVEHYRLGDIVGSATAGTNGNVNLFELPGGYKVRWTGMQVLKHDGSRHHGVGIQPTIPVEPTAQGIADRRDEVLEKAIEALQAQIGMAP